MYSSVAVYLDRYSHLTVKYVLGSLPVLHEYNQKTTSWQPVESPQVVLIDAFRLIAISLYKLNCNYLSAFDELCKSDCSQSDTATGLIGGRLSASCRLAIKSG